MLRCDRHAARHASHQAQSQPQSPATATERAVGLREGFEDPSQIACRNADSVVTDGEHGFIPLLFEGESDLSARFGVFGGILQQIADYLVQSVRIAFDEDGPMRSTSVRT